MKRQVITKKRERLLEAISKHPVIVYFNKNAWNGKLQNTGSYVRRRSDFFKQPG
jgi:hypothetical protein